MGKHSQIKNNSNFIKICIAVSISIFIIATVIILILRYNTEGEKNLPFEINNIRIISTAQGNATNDNVWDLNIIQKNDIYFYIEKNPNYSKEDAISKISFENFKFDKKSNIGTIKMYKPSSNVILYDYTDEYKINDKLSYTGSLTTNIPSLEIGNQGGLIGFSIILDDLGFFAIDKSSGIIHDGKLLSKLNLTQDDISMNVSFDVIIETTSNKTFKTNLSFDLPIGNIIENGREVLDKNNFDDVIFKRY